MVQRLSAGVGNVESECDAIDSERRKFKRYISGINNQITAMNREAWEQQQASHERISRRFSEYIRGVDTYQNPVTNQPVQLPGGYGRAWTNALDEYIVSGSSSYNPNIGSSTNWQPLQRVP